jgi:chromosome segregation ATPase
LINKKSDELREHIEKVSGSIRFKKDYDKLKKKLGVCED